MKKNTSKLTQQSNNVDKRSVARGILFIFLAIAGLAFVGIITENYWLAYTMAGIVAIIILLIIYFALGYMFEKKYGRALTTECDPYKYYRYLKLCRVPYPFLPFNKSFYKMEQAVGLRNQGKFDKAKKVLISADINKFLTPECLVMYYNNLSDLLDLLGDYAAAYNTIEKGFAALEKVDSEAVREYWTHSLMSNRLSLNMREKGETSGVEGYFLDSLEQAQNEYSRIESHYVLGEYYFLTKQYDRALPHLEYIVQHGNKLFHVKDAEKRIGQIKQAGVDFGNAEQYKKIEEALTKAEAKKAETEKAEAERKRLSAEIESAQKPQDWQLAANPNPKKINKPLNIIFICFGAAMALLIIGMLIYTSITAS